ncbi:hypothetical protein OG206_10785 [Streptomyces sp. NBC_01341]|uniref:hypothetical protein n=1 Tax=Streptomyces sp. NBC_01341 TaxID=2903831 RepID=UPI002E10F7B7|nr:hypothetical protein OG206_10785 [Streptomyces sp. NBC_01341]
METMLLDRETVEPPPVTLPALPLAAVPLWVPLLLAGDPDDDGSEPHICRGID